MQPDYLLIGHMTADLTPGGRILGGTVSYAARTVAAFGLKVGVVTSAADNDPLVEHLARYATEVVVVPAASTSTFENVYTDQGRKQYIRGVGSPLRYEDVPEAWRGAPMVHYAPLTGEIDPSTLFSHFQNARTLMTGQGLLRQWGEDGLVHFKRWYDAEALGMLDWLVLSEEDFVQAPELEALYTSAVRNFVVTRAERGGTHYEMGVTHTYATPQVEVIQQTGAGDVFGAALLASLHILNGDAQAALRVAAVLGAIAVTRDGWEGAPTPDEVERALAEVR